MTSAETAQAISSPIQDLGGRFMLSGRTYTAGVGHGFTGLDFYFCGRGGVLGDVDASVVAEEFGFFEPENVRLQWEAGGSVMSRDDASERFMECGYSWAHARLPDGAPYGRFAELVKAALDSVSDDQPALYEAWTRTSWPEDDRSRALHGIHLLRELRGGHHVREVREVGLEPHAAIVVQGGDGTASFFGWPEPHPDPDHARDLWSRAEAATNDDVARYLDALDAEEQDELIRVARALVPKA